MTSGELRIGRRSGGRASRVALRSAPKAGANPCPPGQRGGRYRPLSDRELTQILDTSFRILDEVGMSEAPPMLLEKAQERGASINALGRLSFSRAFVEDIIAGAAKGFVFYGRDPKHDFEKITKTFDK